MSGTGDIPVIACFYGCNVFTHVAQPKVKDSQGFIQVIKEANAVIQAYLSTMCTRDPLSNMACT